MKAKINNEARDTKRPPTDPQDADRKRDQRKGEHERWQHIQEKERVLHCWPTKISRTSVGLQDGKVNECHRTGTSVCRECRWRLKSSRQKAPVPPVPPPASCLCASAKLQQQQHGGNMKQKRRW
uniref:HDC12663 n=1 Tax=Drosophila melanogaster TaxID=7227 RepID=Q6IKE4_DROME|nr:TPA_inf: HDC12663 [Drosophila melanogaster]